MSRRRVVLLAVGGVVVVVGGLLLQTLALAGAFRTLTPHGFEQCTQVKGFTGSEDAVFDATTGLVLISSQDFRTMESGSPAAGTIFSWSPTTRGAPTPVPHDLGVLHPHGLGLYVNGATRRLFVVNHPTPTSSTVELFDLLDGPALKHVRTVSSPEWVSLNDVTPVGPDQFYVTIDAGTVNHTAGRVVETFLRRPWAAVGAFDGTKTSVVATGLKYSNGIAASADGAMVFVSESTGRRLLAYARDATTGALTLKHEVETEAGLDNISLDERGVLWVAAHPKLLEFLAHAKDPAHHSPSQVMRATYADGKLTVQDAAIDDGARLSGSSVALPLGASRFLIGSVFEPHVLDCTLPALP
jgi:arylesterase/paraoxonase